MSGIFYVGQKVRIIEDTCRHGHEIGKVVTLSSATLVNSRTNYWDLEDEEGWVFDQDDCEPYQVS